MSVLGRNVACLSLVAGLALASIAAGPAGAAEVVLFGYSGAFQDNYMAAVVEPFQKEHPDIKVIYNAGGNSAQMLGMLRAQKSSPQVDVSIIDFSISRIANAEGVFAKLDPAIVTNLPDIYSEAMTQAGFGPAITFDHLVMYYSTDVMKTPPTGLKDLINPHNKGKTTFSPAPNVIGTSVMLLTAKSMGIDYKGNLDPVFDSLKKMAQNVQTWQPTPDGYTMVINGTLGIAIGWNARAQLYTDRGAGKLKAITMAEGSILDMDTINLVAGIKDPRSAQIFINYALSAPPQKRLAEIMFYGPTNKKADLAPAVMARTSSDKAILPKMVPIDWEYVAGVQDQWSERWRREVIPAR